MNYPIHHVTTSDNIVLHGILFGLKKSKGIVINIHGSASNFYEEDFIKEMSTTYPKNGFAFLSTNNRGNSVLTHTWQNTGSAIEKFEDCLKDIDAWITFAIKKGYNNIILQGHSLGTEKIVYYMIKGKYKNKVKSIILLGFSDSYGHTHRFISKNKKELFKEAKNLVNHKKGYQFLVSEWYCHGGMLPKSASSFLNQFSEKSELSKALPLRERKLTLYRKIRVPILAIISNNDKTTLKKVVTGGSEHTMIPVKEAIELLKSENSLTKSIIIRNTNHEFEGKEKVLLKNIIKFLKKLKS